MARFLKSRLNTKGQHPGSLIFIGNRKMEKSEIHEIIFSKESCSERQLNDVTEITKSIPANSVLWINVLGVHDTALIAQIGEYFSISPLDLEDILNTDQRPKITEDNTNIIIFLKEIEYRKETLKIHGDQVSLVIGKNYVLTFQEKQSKTFDPVRDRIINNKGRIRTMNSDYLAYSLFDTLVDDYILNIENLGTALEELEQEVLQNPKRETIEKIYRLKTNVSFIRKTIWPLKEIMYFLVKNESGIVHKNTITYLKDLQDLTLQSLEALDIYYNLTSDYLNIYNTNQNNRTTEVMKVLTIFASIFIPLTFITGVYGTNFDVLPELHFKYGYYMMLSGMAIIAAIMLYFFKRKNWF